MLPIFADPPRPIVVNAVTDRYRPVAFDQEKLAGLLAKRMRANTEGYLEHIEDADAGHSSQTGASSGLSAQPGKLLEAAANAFEYRRDEHLRTVMYQVAREVIAAQGGERHPGTESAEETPDVKDVLIRKYDLLGLLAYYRVSQDEAALDAARRIGDMVVKAFPKTLVDRDQYRRAMILIEPLVNLYRYTEESRYLDLCRAAADAWLQAKEPHSDPSSENLADLRGLVELYRVTGDESYFRPVREAWMKVRNEGLSLTGTPLANGDGAAGEQGKSEGDACGTLAWMQLTLNLLRITGEAPYAEQLEHTIYNQLFAAQDASTGAILQPVPVNGSKQAARVADACVASEANGLALIPSAVWGRFGNGIAVVLYNAGRATFQLSRRGTVQLYSEATFPESGDFLLHVEPAHNIRFPLRLRVPAWTDKFTVDVAGSHLIGKPGEFLTLNREWKPGDTVKISIDMSLQVIAGTGDSADQLAVRRGPQVLALARALNPQLNDLGEAALETSEASRPKLLPAMSKMPANWSGDQAYTVAGEYRGKPQELELVPFADARTYRVWLKKPRAASGGTN